MFLRTTFDFCFIFFAGPMNFISSDPDHIEVLESKTASNSTTEVYAFDGKQRIFLIIVLCSKKCAKLYRSAIYTQLNIVSLFHG
jgi:hypothetical protein